MSLEGMVLLGAGAVTAFATSRPVIAGLGVAGWWIVSASKTRRAERSPIGAAVEAVRRRIGESPEEIRDLLAGVESHVNALQKTALGLSKRREDLALASEDMPGVLDESLDRIEEQLAAIRVALEGALATVVRVSAAASSDDGVDDSLASLARELASLDRMVEEVFVNTKRTEER